MEQKKKIRELTAAERQAYNKERYQARQKGSTKLVLEISNCPEDLMTAILAAIKEGR